MNTISTVGDLKKAISVYDDETPLHFKVDSRVWEMITDHSIYSVTSLDSDWKPYKVVIDIV